MNLCLSDYMTLLSWIYSAFYKSHIRLPLNCFSLLALSFDVRDPQTSFIDSVLSYSVFTTKSLECAEHFQIYITRPELTILRFFSWISTPTECFYLYGPQMDWNPQVKKRAYHVFNTEPLSMKSPFPCTTSLSIHSMKKLME